MAIGFRGSKENNLVENYYRALSVEDTEMYMNDRMIEVSSIINAPHQAVEDVFTKAIYVEGNMISIFELYQRIIGIITEQRGNKDKLRVEIIYPSIMEHGKDVSEWKKERIVEEYDWGYHNAYGPEGFENEHWQGVLNKNTNKFFEVLDLFFSKELKELPETGFYEPAKLVVALSNSDNEDDKDVFAWMIMPFNFIPMKEHNDENTEKSFNVFAELIKHTNVIGFEDGQIFNEAEYDKYKRLTNRLLEFFIDNNQDGMFNMYVNTVNGDHLSIGASAWFKDSFSGNIGIDDSIENDMDDGFSLLSKSLMKESRGIVILINRTEHTNYSCAWMIEGNSLNSVPAEQLERMFEDMKSKGAPPIEENIEYIDAFEIPLWDID